MKNILVIGSTGIIGRPIVRELINDTDVRVYCIALDKTQFPESSVKQYVSDRRTDNFKALLSVLTSEVERWEAVVDICAFGSESARALVGSLRGRTNQFITITTTLVYDRSQKNDQPITEETGLIQEGLYGGYVDGKVGLEKFWQSQDVNWTLLRPYHILGAHSLLGCLPYHNRDPKLLGLINQGQTLKLANGGETHLGFINPKDIAVAIRKIIGNEKTYRQAYNLVAPQPIIAKDYYLEIGRQLGKEVLIEAASIKEIWERGEGWEMTTLPHIYSAEKLERDTGFTATISLSQAITDSIATYPAEVEGLPVVHQRMNKLPKPIPPSWIFED